MSELRNSKKMLKFIFVLALSVYVMSQNSDIGLNPRVFETDTLPGNRLMATIGNGHIATVVYSTTVYMDGLYNGLKGESHRARIPSQMNIRIQNPSSSTLFILDTEKGLFSEKIGVNDVLVEQITFAHRLYTPLLVVQITADFSQSIEGSITLNLRSTPGLASGDITFTAPQNFSLGQGIEQSGFTNIVEDPKYQSDFSPVHVVYSNVPDTVTLNEESPTATFIMSISSTYEEASQAYLYAYNLIESGTPGEIVQSHVEQWAKIWNAGNIILEGTNLELAKVTAGSLYYLLSSLPYQEGNVDRKRFYGLSPGSLARGAASQDYQGHSFWDTETWMYPPVLLFWPHVAKDLLLYRMANVVAARDRANATGYKGIRYPWESGYTGTEVTPDCCPETRDNQQHITSDISFAARQYWSLTNNLAWLNGESYSFPLEINGCNFIRDMAEFWSSRVEYNTLTGKYDINGVMPPDEDHPYVNNSIYTNVGAALSIFFAKEIECLCNTISSIPEEWLDIARNLKIPYDSERVYHPEFDGYTIGDVIKQADVVLLGYPISYVTDPTERRNDLEIYENVTRTTGPAMTWGMHAIGYLELDDDVRAESLFNRSYQPYKTEPFKIWTEAPNENGAVNFITGMGGFLQALLAGYAGIRVNLDQVTFNPKLPLGITNFTIKGLDYLDCSFDVSITDDTVGIFWDGDMCQTLTIVPGTSANTAALALTNGRGSLNLGRGPFVIRPVSPLQCSSSQQTYNFHGRKN